ncbi:ABC-F family ATP-binding cassette domain-containing protein [Dermabacteraceae bacterium P13138]
MPTISFTRVSFAYPTRDVLENVSFACGGQDRICLVGPNGAGKTTLLRLARGELEPLSGTVSAPKAVPRPALPGSATVADAVNAGLRELIAIRDDFEEVTRLLENSQETSLLERYAALLAQMDAKGVWEMETNIERVLSGLDLGDLDWQRPLAALSPGQQGRLRLAATLVASPQALVLDEPTNHLDSSAKEYLTCLVREWEGPVLYASHDRSFIEKTATGLLDLDTAPWEASATLDGLPWDNGAHLCRGNYSHYLAQKRLARERHRVAHGSQREEKQGIERHRKESEVVGHKNFKPRAEGGAAQKFYADRTQKASTRRINNDSRRLEELSRSEVRKPRYASLEIRLPQPAKAPAGVVVAARGVSVPGRLAPVTCQVSAGQHVLIVGPNGAGKSTLLRLLQGEDISAPVTGELTVFPGSVLIPQTLPVPGDGLIPDSAWQSGMGEAGKGFLDPRFWHVPVGQLSDGNRRRAQFAAAASLSPCVLLIDEPTNYLDLDTIEALEAALASWQGTLIVTSHDEWLIGKWLEDGTARPDWAGERVLLELMAQQPKK